MTAQTTEQQTANTQLQAQVKALSTELATLKSTPADTSKVDAQLKSLDAQVKGFDAQFKSLGADITALKKQGNPSAAIDRLEQEIVILKSEQDNRPAAAQGGTSTAEFDAFRAQMTRNINTLQAQIQNLQRQLNARP